LAAALQKGAEVKNLHHNVVIVGGGSAGITVAARLAKAKVHDVAIIEPSVYHYYQPLWTLVGGGVAKAAETVRDESKYIPQGVTWVRDKAITIDPDAKTVTTEDDLNISYDYLVVCPGIQLDWNRLPGSAEMLGKDGVSSNYTYELAPKTWEFLSATKKGTAIFTMPSGPIKCAGAPQKIAYLAADYWRSTGVLSKIDVHLVLPTPGMFGVPEFAKVLEQVVARYGIQVHFQSEVVEINPATKTATIVNNAEGGTKSTLDFDFMHVVPPQSAPDWIKSSAIADPDNPAGYVQIDKNTMQHTRYPDIFALGDAGSSPNSKTGAAIRKQAPVVVQNLLDHMANKPLSASYGGYASCPLVTSRRSMLLAEFDYTLKPTPSIPLIDTKKERYDMWLLKRYGLPLLYWNFMLKGLA
jgi:sulfide:quinone oxidoreductase